MVAIAGTNLCKDMCSCLNKLFPPLLCLIKLARLVLQAHAQGVILVPAYAAIAILTTALQHEVHILGVAEVPKEADNIFMPQLTMYGDLCFKLLSVLEPYEV
jgi:hypothetical protein